MKKLALLFFAAASFVAVSCNKDITSVDGQEEVTATFTVAIPDQIATKAYSDGLTATELHYAVYDGNTDRFLKGTTSAIALDKRTASVDINLVKGYPYHIVFWAQAPGNKHYTFDKSAATVTVTNYTSVANDESRDAFYQVVKDYYYTATPETVKLYRPFAQINFLSSDYSDARSLIGNTMKSKVEIKGLPNVLNLLSGEATGSLDAAFEYAPVPAVSGETLVVKNSNAYGYVSMNYVLANLANTELLTVGASFYMGGNGTVSVTVPSVPYQRNFRTNIISSALFTGDATFTVEVVPGYGPGEDGKYDTDDDNHWVNY